MQQSVAATFAPVHLSTLLSTDEALCVARGLLDPAASSGWPETSMNMASASQTPEGEVLVHLLGITERHHSMTAFLKTYGIAHVLRSS